MAGLASPLTECGQMWTGADRPRTNGAPRAAADNQSDGCDSWAGRSRAVIGPRRRWVPGSGGGVLENLLLDLQHLALGLTFLLVVCVNSATAATKTGPRITVTL